MKITGCLFLALVILSLCGCGAAGEPATEPAPALVEPVGIAPDMAVVERGDIEALLLHSDDTTSRTLYTGYVDAYTEYLSFSVSGTLDAIPVLQGQQVQAGDVLATLDGETLQTQIRALESTVSDAKTVHAYRDRIFEARIKIAQEELALLQESGAAAETCRIQEAEIEILEAQRIQAQESHDFELRNYRNQITQLSAGLTDLELTAPFDGVISYIDSQAQSSSHSHIARGMDLIGLRDDTHLRLETDYIDRWTLETAERVTAIINGREYELTYSPYTEAEEMELTRNDALKTRFLFAQPPEDVPCGSPAMIKVIQESRQNVLRLPSNAVYEDNLQFFVLKDVEGQRIRTAVEIGLANDAWVEIRTGLQEGDVVYVQN